MAASSTSSSSDVVKFEDADLQHVHDISGSLPTREHIMASLLEGADDEPGASPAATLCGVLFCPITAICSFLALDTQEQAVVLSFGNYAETIKTPGIHWKNCCGRELRKVSTKIISTEMQRTTVIDRNGNPLIISAIVAYQIVNAKHALLNVENVTMFVMTQAEAAIKQGLSRFPYESSDGSPCLKKEASHIGQQLCFVLQEKVMQAGVYVHSLQLSNIQYAPEIAAAMLKRQQATAMVEARNVIVEGAVDIACHAVEKLEARGITMENEDKVRIVSNLLTVICSESETHTTLPLIGRH